jgi:hypothetical protein
MHVSEDIVELDITLDNLVVTHLSQFEIDQVVVYSDWFVQKVFLF